MPTKEDQPARAPQAALNGSRRYLIASRRGPALAASGFLPMSASHLRGLVNAQSGLEVVRTIRPHQVPMTAMGGTEEATETYVVTMDEDRAEVLRSTAPGHLIVEEDLPLDLGMPAAVDAPAEIAARAMSGGLKPQTVKFKVLGDQDRPVAKAVVAVNIPGMTVRGMTDDKGEVALQLFVHPQGRPRSVVVTAPNNHWSCLVREPALSTSETAVIRLQALEESMTGFPEHYHYGWGARMMGLDRIDRRLNGRGVKIAIVDSGVDKQPSASQAHPQGRGSHQ